MDDTFEQRVFIACLHPHITACATGLTAARLWGMWSATETVDIAVRYPHKLTAPDATVHRSRDLVAEDITRLDAIPLTTPSRTLCDLGRVLPQGEVQRILNPSIATGLVTRGRVMEVRIRVGVQGRNGAGTIDRALACVPQGAEATESGGEVATLRALEVAGLPTPEAQWGVTVRRNRYRLDFAYPAERVALEYDGHEHHHTPAQRAADLRRQRALESVGWLVIRVRHEDLEFRRRAGLTQLVRDALRQRRPSLPWNLAALKHNPAA